jgi:hypothetical protein
MAKKASPLTHFALVFHIMDMQTKTIHKSFTKSIPVFTIQRISKLLTQIKPILIANSGGVMKCVCATTMTGDDDAITALLLTYHT